MLLSKRALRCLVVAEIALAVIGGLVTSTALTLFVLPALYRRVARERPEVEL